MSPVKLDRTYGEIPHGGSIHREGPSKTGTNGFGPRDPENGLLGLDAII